MTNTLKLYNINLVRYLCAHLAQKAKRVTGTPLQVPGIDPLPGALASPTPSKVIYSHVSGSHSVSGRQMRICIVDLHI